MFTLSVSSRTIMHTRFFRFRIRHVESHLWSYRSEGKNSGSSTTDGRGRKGVYISSGDSVRTSTRPTASTIGLCAECSNF